MRISDSYRTATQIQAVQANLSRMDKAQRQISTGRRLERPSDGPTDAATATLLRAQEADADRYAAAISDAESWFGTQDNALQSASTLLSRAKDLATQSLNGSLDANARNAIATELDGLREQLGGLANTTFMGKAVFGAFGTSAVTLTPTSATFNGNAGAQVRRQIGANEFVDVNGNGSQIFGFSAGDDVFSVLARLSQSVRSGSTASIQADATALDARATDVRNALGDVGARWARVKARDTEITDRKLTVSNQRSRIEDTDVNEAALQLAQANSTYQSVLAMISRVSSASLVNFLR